jgi:hypothetical protein
MFRAIAVSSALVLGMMTGLAVASAAQAPAPPVPPVAPSPPPAAPADEPAVPSTPSAVVPATPENAAAFLGEWILSSIGPNGAEIDALSIKADAGKIAATLTSDVQGVHVITDGQKSGASLLLAYDFNYQGMPVPVVLTLTLGADNKITVQFDFARGAMQMPGSATRKP